MARRTAVATLNQTAIAKVLAAYLVDRGLLAEFEEGEWPRSRRDWVRSRLAGAVLTHLELELFMDAFGLEETEREPVAAPARDRLPTACSFPVRSGSTGLPDRSRRTPSSA